MFEETFFGSPATEYLRSCLVKGDNIAAELLKLPLETGCIFGLLPTGISESRKNRLTEGGLMKIKESEIYIREFIIHQLGVIPRCTMYFETSDKKGDPLLPKLARRSIHWRGKVFTRLTQDDRDYPIVELAVREARYYPFVAAICANSFDIQSVEPSEADLCATLKQTRYIIFDAFDGETKLIWSSQP